MTRLALIAFLLMTPLAAKVRSLEVRILSTMLADDDGFGEWGFSALVIADGHRILFDTGAHPDTVLRNVRELKIDLSERPRRYPQPSSHRSHRRTGYTPPRIPECPIEGACRQGHFPQPQERKNAHHQG